MYIFEKKKGFFAIFICGDMSYLACVSLVAQSKSGRRSKSSSTAVLNLGHDEGVNGDVAAAAAGASSGAPVQNCGS